jgi:hypothetical protein
MVASCRQYLEADVRRQLEGTFGVRPQDGVFLEPKDFHPAADSDPAYLARRKDVLDAIGHLERTRQVSRAEAVAQFVRETAFTGLNRLAALKLMEHPERALIRESVSRVRESAGYKQFLKVCPGLTRAARNNNVPDGGYRLYLECLFDDLATDLGVLFDRRLPQAIIFPSDACLREVLNQVNAAHLQAAWGSYGDETIGWIYQYFTPGEHRREVRRQAAPQNPYELACRNQFYTPRYVVQFLVDNTLGRIWYEMRKGNTALADPQAPCYCRYMVRPPGEDFLGPEETPPTPGPSPNLPEDLLSQPTPVSHRALKDPRDIRVLDPASGSGHFLLYASELLTNIYLEAWDDSEMPAFGETSHTLREDFPNRDDFERRLPGLILRYNLFGIDIDLRSTQIAALALWLRAQRSLKNVKIADRPTIRRTNIVCAEPMPGEREDLADFVGSLQPRVLGQLVEAVFEHMEGAGEIGSLLKVEEQLEANITAARKRWIEGPQLRQGLLFDDGSVEALREGTLFDPSGVTDEEFWKRAFSQVLNALQDYAELSAEGSVYRRRLFADDAARGFAFVDLCRHKFDVVLMNPPFGDASVGSKEYVDNQYQRGKSDILAAFVERGLQKLHPGGKLGAITNRTVFFLTTYRQWREKLVLGLARPTVFADLGDGVLDTALVEASAYCLEVSR